MQYIRNSTLFSSLKDSIVTQSSVPDSPSDVVCGSMAAILVLIIAFLVFTHRYIALFGNIAYNISICLDRLAIFYDAAARRPNLTPNGESGHSMGNLTDNEKEFRDSRSHTRISIV